MEFTFGKIDRASGTVPATFTHAGITVTRPVVACLSPTGTHDRAATAARVAQLAPGMARKMELGLFPPPPQ